MVSVTVIKSVLLFAMIVVTTVAVLLPFCVVRVPRIKGSNAARRNFILSILNCFGGGVFIATGKWAVPLVTSLGRPPQDQLVT